MGPSSESISSHANSRLVASAQKREKKKAKAKPKLLKTAKADAQSAAIVSAESENGDAREKFVTNTANEAMYLEHKLLDVLNRQVVIDEEHQKRSLLSRHELRRLYDENATYRNMIASAEFRMRNEGKRRNANDTASITEAESIALAQRMNLAQRNCNRLKHEIKRLQEKVNEQEKKEREAEKIVAVAAASLDHASLDMALSRSGSVGLRIKKLEKDLNVVLSQHRVAEMIMEGYQEQIRALNKESAEYDTQLKVLDAQYAKGRVEHLQLVTLYENTKYDYAKTVKEREAFSEHVKEQRKLKEKFLADRRAEVQNAILEGERAQQALSELQMRLSDETQLLEGIEATHQELLTRAEQKKNAEAISTGATAHPRGSISGAGTGPRGRESEMEEQLSAYQLALVELEKQTNTEHRDEIQRVFLKEIALYDQLRAQAAQKREYLEKLEDEVRRLRISWENTRVCAAATSGSHDSLHTSVTLEAELRTFVSEAQENLHKLVREEELRRLMVAGVCSEANRMIQTLIAYRPEIEIRQMNEGDTHLPVHFTALTQKILALCDEATSGAKGEVAVPSAVPIIIPENNVRINVPGTGEGGRAARPSAVESATGAGSYRGARLQEGSQNLEDSALCFTVTLTQDGQRLGAQPSVVSNSDLDDDDEDLKPDGLTGEESSGYGYQMDDSICRDTSNSTSVSPTSVSAARKLRSLTRPLSASVVGGGDPSGRGIGSGLVRPGTAGSKRRSSNISDDPLRREELKRMSLAIKDREKKRRKNEERRLAMRNGE